MRSRQRRLRPMGIAAGASLVGIATTAAALAAGPADAQSATRIKSLAHHIAPGRELTVSGSTSAAEAGQTVVLQFAPLGSDRWRNVSAGKVAPRGGFRLRGRLSQSGRVRVVGAGAGVASDLSGGGASATSAGAGPVPASSSRTVTVGSVLALRAGEHDLLAGQALSLGGRLLPGTAGRWLALQGLTQGRWRTLTIARTGRRGGFMFHLHPGMGSRALRVRFAGDRRNTAISGGAGRVVVFRQALASWYDDSGSTACGFHAGYGVANKDLPCGTQVTFRYGGHTVTATVDDRGPYVGGREYDLNQNTAAALGFSGVDTVWSSS